MSEPLRALVVGCGGVGSRYDDELPGASPVTHAAALAAAEGVELAGGVDPDPAARARFAERRGVPAWEGLNEALDAVRPAIVSVCSPPAAHAEAVAAAVAAGARAVWCEKPLAPSVAEARAIEAACARAGAALQVNFVRRFDAVHARVAAELRGVRAHVDVRYSGTLENYGSHAVDLVRWFLGALAWVRAVPVADREPIVALGTDAGSTATLAQVTNDDCDVFDVEIYTPTGRVTITALGEQLARAGGEPSVLFPGYVSLGHGNLEARDGLQHAMSRAAESLVAHLRDGAPLRCAGADGVAALVVAEAARRSLDAGGAAVEVRA